MFKCKIEQLELMNALKKIKILSAKGSVYQFSKYVYMQVFKDKDSKYKLRLFRSVGYESAEIVIDNIIEYEEGSMSLIEFDMLYKLLETINDDIEVTLEQCENNKIKLHYSNKNKPIELMGVDNNDFSFPTISDVLFGIAVETNILKEGVMLANNIITENKNNPILNCVNIVIDNGIAEFHAINMELANIMLLFRKQIKHKNKGSFFIEVEKIKRILSIFNDVDPTTIFISKNNAILVQNNSKFIINLLNGAFIDIKKFFVNQFKVMAKLNKEELLTALKRVNVLMEKDNISAAAKKCVLDIKNEYTTISYNSICGSVSENIQTVLQGAEIRTCFNVNSIIKILNSINDEYVCFGFYSKNFAIIMPLDNKEAFTYYLVSTIKE